MNSIGKFYQKKKDGVLEDKVGLVGEPASWAVWERRSRKKKKWLERHNEGNGIEKYTELQVGERGNVNGIIMLIFRWILFVIRDEVKEREKGF